jgi:membrane-bound lytic murein transglycosylase A
MLRPVAAALALLTLLLSACAERKEAPRPPVLLLEPVAFTALPGWREDDPSGALEAFRRSCARLARQDDGTPFGPAPIPGTVADWRPACADAARTPLAADAARAFFEAVFTPYRVTDRGRAEGLFTGYYEPLLAGARTPDDRFRYPLYRRPPDLVGVDLGRFDPELSGRRIAGRVEDGQLIPYYPRASIEQGALAGRGLELLWLDDPIGRFFLQIQGSGQIRLREGGIVRVGYADQNGHPYYAIGRELAAMGAIPQERMSMQAIRAWLLANPAKAPEIMAKNRSYVFFREQPELAGAPGPLGAQGVPLTPGRSLAVDRRFLPLGAPLWLDASAPYPEGERPLRRLLVAQDTGGAIRGPVRGDLFWGSGPLAEHLAGHMQSTGRLFLLLPRGLAPTS